MFIRLGMEKYTWRNRSGMHSSARWALAIIVAMSLMQQANSVTAVFMVPVYEWTLVWSETRNPNYVYGGIWRPTMIANYDPDNFPGKKNIEIDGYDLNDYISKSAVPVHLGDVWQPGNQPPDFVGTVLVLDPAFAGLECPRGIPCYLRDESEYSYTGILTVTPDKNSFQTVWSSFIAQCKQQIGRVPDLCDGEDLSSGACVAETGFQGKTPPITFQKPTCPTDFYVMGHIALRGSNGTVAAELPMPEYKCLHETILRQTNFQTKPLFTGAQPGTSVWNNKLVAVQYYLPISLWPADCSAESCGGSAFCEDTVSMGLFYASASETSPDFVITGKPTDTKATGPRCLVHFRDCTPRRSDGKFVSDPGGNASLSFTSLCESELGLRTIEPKVRIQGVTSVQPSGLPSRSDFPALLTIRANRDLCNYIVNQDDDNLNQGVVYVNRVKTQWVSMAVGGFCSFQVLVPLDGEIKPGPATLEITTKKPGVVGSRAKDTAGKYIGLYIGRLYIYVDPSRNSTLLEPIVYNGPMCELSTIVKLPTFTQTIQYNTASFQCQFRDKDVPLAAAAATVRSANLIIRQQSLRAVQCYIPPSTTSLLTLSISINGGVNYHDLTSKLQRVPYAGSDFIPGEGALRLYGVTPRSGPQTGGTKVTLIGQYFTKYCDNGDMNARCNRLMCRFRFAVGGREEFKTVLATLVDDKTLTCVTPSAMAQASEAKVEVSIDGNVPCSADTFNGLVYNLVYFYYQTDGTDAAIPSASTPINPDPTVAPHRLEGDWISCSVPGACSGFPYASESISSFGYVTCLRGFTDANGSPTSIKYPVWCIRALPINAAASYQFTMVDSMLRTTVFTNRPTPELYPGACHRTTHHMPWNRLKHQLDYRVFDAFDFSYQRGDPIPRGKVTQGRNLIDRIFSTTAIQMKKTPGATLEYMRAVLHQIGERDGFIDLSLSFYIMLDFTLARGYNEEVYRGTVACAKGSPSYGRFSGFLGDTGPTGSFVDWLSVQWTRGVAACSKDPRWEGKCENKIEFSPDKPDDTGVMLTRPASAVVEQNAEDEVVGCGRLRVGFDCSSFDMESCLQEVFKRTPDSAYSNFGAKTPYSSLVSFCDFSYPETSGPNNPSKPGSAPVLEDWRYFYRTSPCVKCRQARDICAALARPEPIVDGLPAGSRKFSLGDTNFAAEIPLGCFGPNTANITGAVEDQCCDDVTAASSDGPYPGTCSLTTERCVRPRGAFLCARNDDDKPNQCSGESCGDGCKDMPMCAPRGIV